MSDRFEKRCSTSIRARLLRAWAELAQDPGRECTDRLTEGSPAGIDIAFPDWGIFPTIEDETVEDPEVLSMEWQDFVNYAVVENDREAQNEVLRFTEGDPPPVFGMLRLLRGLRQLLGQTSGAIQVRLTHQGAERQGQEAGRSGRAPLVGHFLLAQVA